MPTGDFLAHVGDWTGICRPPSCSGCCAAPRRCRAGASDELERLKTRSPTTRRRGRSSTSDGDPGEMLARAARAATARPAPRSTATSTSSATGCSTASTSPSRYALELPDALLRAIRVAVDGRDRRRRRRRRSASPSIRAQVPEEHRAEFDELLGEARLMYRLRDERGVFSDIWASGIMRRAALAAGRRLAARGRDRTTRSTSSTPSFDEMCALVTRRGRAVGRRARRRAPSTAHATTAKDAPPFLGDPPPPPPDPSGLPPGVARVMRADRHRARRAVRQLRGRARGGHAARPRREPGRLRRAGAP